MIIKTLVGIFLSIATLRAAVGFTVTPTTEEGMRVDVSSGSAVFPDMPVVNFDAATLTLDTPEFIESNNVYYYNGSSPVRGINTTAMAPNNYAGWWDPWQPWPGQGRPVFLVPGDISTSKNALNYILGSMYRSIDPESVTVTNNAGDVTYAQDSDYVFNADWGQIGNISGRLGSATDSIRVSYKYVPQRLDLIQVNKSGVLSVKKGTPQPVCPELPEPDTDNTGLAGIYIHTYDAYTVSADDINIINPVPAAEPVNKNSISATITKLQSGAATRIAFLGSSTADGAEAGKWWSDHSLTWRGRVLTGIAERIPGSTPVEISTAAHVGGTTSKVGLDLINNTIIPQQNDLCLIAFGSNDANGAIGKSANVSISEFNILMRAQVTALQNAEIDVILVNLYDHHPFHAQRVARLPDYCEVMLTIARDLNVGYADIYSDWQAQASHGISPESQLHNNNNHAGVDGHALIANTVLKFFENTSPVIKAPPLKKGELTPLRITPNPFSTGFAIQTGSDCLGRCAAIIDGAGRIVDSFHLNGNEHTYAAAGMFTGDRIYFLKINGEKAIHKLIYID